MYLWVINVELSYIRNELVTDAGVMIHMHFASGWTSWLLFEEAYTLYYPPSYYENIIIIIFVKPYHEHEMDTSHNPIYLRIQSAKTDKVEIVIIVIF